MPIPFLRRKFFGAKSFKETTLEDINDQLGNIRIQRKFNNLSKEQYKKYKGYLEELEDKKFESVKVQEDKVKKMMALLNKRKEVALKKQKTELRNIVVRGGDYTAGKEYVVSAALRIRYRRQNKSKAWIIREADVMISEDITAQDGDTTYDMLERAWNQYRANNFNSDSDQEILHRSNIAIVPRVHIDLAKVKMKGVSMLYKTFKDIPHLVEGQCVIDYLLWEASKVDSHKRWTRASLQERLGDEPDTSMLALFCRTEGDVSMYALDMTLKVFQVVKSVEKNRMALFFIVNNNHLYPIVDDSLRRKIVAKQEVSFEDIRLSMKDYEDVSVLDESLISNAEGNHVIVKGVDDLTQVAGKIMKESASLSLTTNSLASSTPRETRSTWQGVTGMSARPSAMRTMQNTRWRTTSLSTSRGATLRAPCLRTSMAPFRVPVTVKT